MPPPSHRLSFLCPGGTSRRTALCMLRCVAEFNPDLVDGASMTPAAMTTRQLRQESPPPLAGPRRYRALPSVSPSPSPQACSSAQRSGSTSPPIVTREHLQGLGRDRSRSSASPLRGSGCSRHAHFETMETPGMPCRHGGPSSSTSSAKKWRSLAASPSAVMSSAPTSRPRRSSCPSPSARCNRPESPPGFPRRTRACTRHPWACVARVGPAHPLTPRFTGLFINS